MSNAQLQPFHDADFEAIEQTMLASARGRWFLHEYARRNRHADTSVLVSAIARIEQTMQEQHEHSGLDRFRTDLVEMSSAIADMRVQIAALRVPGDDGPTHFDLATNELDAILQSTESATTDILAAAESVQDAAWTLREGEIEGEICDALDREATNIYTACSFQDLTAQRTRKVIEVLRYVEGRINAMIEIWGFSEGSGEVAANLRSAETGDGDPTLTQSDIDFVLVDDGGHGGPVVMDADRRRADSLDDPDSDLMVAQDEGHRPAPEPLRLVSPPPTLQDMIPRGPALADIDRMSQSDKLALFL